MSASVGERAPDFHLPATGEKETLSLADFHGRPLVVLFYPLDFSGTCTKELCSVRDGLSMYTSLGADVIGVSVDSLYAHRAFAEKEHLTFPLLADFMRDMSRAYGVLDEKRNFAKRSAFVIDRSGVIRYRSVSDDPSVLPDFDEVRSALQAAS